MVEQKTAKSTSQIEVRRPISSFRSLEEHKDYLAQFPHPFEEIYHEQDTPEWRSRVEQTAKLMLQHGLTDELDFIIEKYPERFRDWVEHNEDVKGLVEEFGWSNKWLSWALARTYNLDFNNIYRASRVSPVRRYIGDITVHPREVGFYDDSKFAVKIIEPQGVDLSDIRTNSRIEHDFNEYSTDSQGYLKKLEIEIANESDDRLRHAWIEVRDFYQSVDDIVLPALKEQIRDQDGHARRDAGGGEVLFPSTHQKAAIAKAGREKSLAVFDGTGSGKTAIGIGTAEYVRAERILVVCPATVKQSWEQKIDEYYIEPPEVLRLESENAKKFIEHGLNGSKYTIVNYDLLIDRQEGNGESLSAVGQALLASDFDLLILDEAHYINNQNKRSDAVLELAKKIERRLILTANPIRNGIEDISRIAYLLAPNEFASPDALRELGPSGVPAIVDLLASKTVRRKTEDLLELPLFAPESDGKIDFVNVEFCTTQQAVYDVIFDDSAIDAFTKIKLLRQAAIDHNLLTGGRYKIPFDEESAQEQLEQAYKTWLKQRANDSNTAFDSQFLVNHGFRNLFLGGHFKYRQGFETVIGNSGNEGISHDWSGTEQSTKFRQVKDLIGKRMANGEKVVVFTGHFVKGVLRERDLFDDVASEEITSDLYSYLSREFPEIGIGRIDGEVTINAPKGRKSKRDLERAKWQNDPNMKVLLTSVSTASLGIDFTVNDGITTGVSMVGLDLPYTYADLWQMISRVYRFGQNTPVHPFILEAGGTIDEGIHELIVMKEEIAQQVIDGVMPTEIERKVLERSKENSTLRDYINSPKKELWQRMYSMRGKGAKDNNKYLEETLANGKSVGEQIAELYSRHWEYSASGHNARLVGQVIDGLKRELKVELNWIVDAGSGPLVLDRTLRQESDGVNKTKVISVDLNKHMLAQGVRELENQGHKVDSRLVIAKPMSETGIKDDSVDAVVCSLALHYSNSTEDRAKTVREANRILKTDGYYLISLHESYLTPEQAKKFAIQLEQFGFEVDVNLSGRGKSTDYKEAPFAVWLFVARKIGTPHKEDISLDDFHFAFEASKVSKFRDGREKTKKNDEKENGKLVKHEKFTIIGLDDNSTKGSPDELLSRLSLGLTEQSIKKLGWAVETRKTKQGTNLILRK